MSNFTAYRYRIKHTDKNGELEVKYITRYVYPEDSPEKYKKQFQDNLISEGSTDIEITYKISDDSTYWELI